MTTITGRRRRGWPAGPPVLTNADGQFTIGKLRKGTYDLTVEGPRGASHAEKTGVKTGDSVTIQLLSLGTMTGKVTVGGKPVTVYDIDCDGPLRRRGEARHRRRRQLHARSPRARHVQVRCQRRRRHGPRHEDRSTRRPRHAGLRAHAVGDDHRRRRNVLTKQPIAGAHAVAGGSMFGAQNFNDMLTGKSPTTDANGRFTINRVAVGKGSVAIMPKDGFTPLGQRDYNATEGQTVDVGTIEVIPPREGEAGTFGFSTEVKEKDLVVASVKAGGPAEAAGMQVGDVITSINGKSVDALTPPIAALLLASGTPEIGQTIQLEHAARRLARHGDGHEREVVTTLGLAPAELAALGRLPQMKPIVAGRATAPIALTTAPLRNGALSHRTSPASCRQADPSDHCRWSDGRARCRTVTHAAPRLLRLLDELRRAARASSSARPTCRPFRSRPSRNARRLADRR